MDGHRLPDDHHKIIYEGGVPLIESDFYYEPNIVVLVHGSVHHLEYVQDMDSIKETAVHSAGYIVVIVRPDDIRNLTNLID